MADALRLLQVVDANRPAGVPMGSVRKPEWLKVKAPGGPNYLRLKGLLRALKLHTVCEEARCPNIGECFEDLTATFMILGDICSRRCGYCAVTHGRPVAVDPAEPERVAEAVQVLGLDHAVITSVNRDDLPDGGAGAFAATIHRIREQAPGCTIEVLIPDFKGARHALEAVLAAGPDILNHNTETVRRLYPAVRPGGRYDRAMELLARAKEMGRGVRTKSGLVLGLGEERDEIRETMADLVRAGCDILTLGQYLRPSPHHLPVASFYHPEEFAELKVLGEGLGFRHVESGPLVRSSYHASRQVCAGDSGKGPREGAGPWGG